MTGTLFAPEITVHRSDPCVCDEAIAYAIHIMELGTIAMSFTFFDSCDCDECIDEIEYLA